MKGEKTLFQLLEECEYVKSRRDRIAQNNELMSVLKDENKQLNLECDQIFSDTRNAIIRDVNLILCKKLFGRVSIQNVEYDVKHALHFAENDNVALVINVHDKHYDSFIVAMRDDNMSSFQNQGTMYIYSDKEFRLYFNDTIYSSSNHSIIAVERHISRISLVTHIIKRAGSLIFEEVQNVLSLIDTLGNNWQYFQINRIMIMFLMMLKRGNTKLQGLDKNILKIIKMMMMSEILKIKAIL
jgi:hypothetical protein